MHPIELPVGLRNRTGCTVHLHELRLIFKGQWPDVPEEVVSIKSPCHGRTMADGQFMDFLVPVLPSLVFLRYTNTYLIEVHFSKERISAVTEVVRIEGEHIIVRDCQNYAGVEAFVSFKDEEDLDLAELEKALLNRAGIRGYLARDDVQPGLDYWDKIAGHIKSSVATFVVWTKNTAAQYDSVLREITLSEESNVPVVLLLEHGVDAPIGLGPIESSTCRFDANRQQWHLRQLPRLFTNAGGARRSDVLFVRARTRGSVGWSPDVSGWSVSCRAKIAMTRAMGPWREQS
jgi:hypothetical protein